MLKTLGGKLIAVCVAITAASLMAMSLGVFQVVQHNNLNALDLRIGQLTRIHAQELADWVREKQRITSSMRIAVDQADPIPFIVAAKQAGDFDDTYIVYANKKHVFNHPMPATYDGTVRPWYKQGIQEGGPAVTPAYVDASTGKLTISFVEPFGSKGDFKGVLGTDMHLDTVAKAVAAIKPIEKSFAFVMDGEGKLLATENAKLILKPVEELAPDLDATGIKQVAGSGRYQDVVVDGARMMVYAAKVAGTPWTLAIAIDHAQATASVRELLQLTVGLTVLCVVVASALVATVVRRQLQRLGAVRDALNEIASGDGDLSRRLDTHGDDELAHIAQSFNRFVDKIAGLLLKVRDTAESVRVASSEIASGNLDLSNRTESQARSLAETASAMEQLTATVQQNVANAQEANGLSGQASDVAARGGDVVGQVVSTMGGIQQSARKIVDIISVIDGIAFQTNILALNAAVEAARAGEQGRGFAVVAGEVRTLAQRSAQAAKEIKSLIDNSVAQVEQGSQLVQNAGSTMDQVVDSVRRVTAIVAEISVASREQGSGIESIGGKVALMDQSTQQNAALVEQAAAATRAMQEQAAQLADVVAGFKLTAHG
ncbi:methyl-accepting chemotaxis protein [Sphaerotilus natans]|uniref:methyl-accepting chemotaxis protein n=1 Tax=Sphaerotilus natans TaxID=34103 RepID=UPI00406C9E04